MTAAALVACVYCVLIVRHLMMAGRLGGAARMELMAVRELLAGAIDPADYRALMESAAADAHVEHPVTVPDSPC